MQFVKRRPAVKVVDVSRWAPCCSASRRLRLLDAGLIAPALVHFEVANAYDASYPWLARRTGAELVTLDRRLEAAGATAS
jgi:hypothetical protein